MPHRRLTEEERLERRTLRFMTRVHMEPNSGCWLWSGQKSKAGYGRFKVKKDLKNKGWAAHRWAAKYIGGMDIEGQFVCHHCDVRLCVNPDHLFVGSHQDNMDDMVSKGRQIGGICKGSQHGRAKLTEADIPLIRALIAKGIQLKLIAPLFNISPETIGDIKHGRKWTHVP